MAGTLHSNAFNVPLTPLTIVGKSSVSSPVSSPSKKFSLSLSLSPPSSTHPSSYLAHLSTFAQKCYNCDTKCFNPHLHLSLVVLFVLQDDWSPLYLASGGGYLEIMKTLIEAGANVNQATKVGTCMSGHSHTLFAHCIWLSSLATLLLLFWGLRILL